MMSIINPNRYIPKVEWSFSEFSDKNFQSIAKTLAKKFYFDSNDLSINLGKIAARDQAQLELVDLQDKLLLEKILEKMSSKSGNSKLKVKNYNSKKINKEFASYGQAILIDTINQNSEFESIDQYQQDHQYILIDAYDIVEKNEVVDGQNVNYFAFEKIPNKKYKYTKFAG